MKDVPSPRGPVRGLSHLRAYHLHYLLVVFVVHCVLCFVSLRLHFSDFRTAERVTAMIAFVVPLTGYFLAFWTARPFNRCGPITRTFSVTVFTIAALTIASFAMAAYFYYFGMPL